MRHDEDTVRSFAKEVLRLGHECRDLSVENSRLKAEAGRLRTIINFLIGFLIGVIIVALFF